ncbi:hypothetical protein Tco_0172452 [Tanacetum coccineum]
MLEGPYLEAALQAPPFSRICTMAGEPGHEPPLPVYVLGVRHADDEIQEAEEEHSAPAYPVVVALPATVPSAEETEPFETDESAATPPLTMHIVYEARIVLFQSPLPVTSIGLIREEVRPRLPTPRTRVRYRSGSGYEVGGELPPMLLLDQLVVFGQITALLPLKGTDRSGCGPERYVGYGITDSWDEIVETLQGAPVSTDTELETEAGMSREAWGRAMDASDLAHGGVISLCTTVHATRWQRSQSLQSARPVILGHHTAGAGDSLTGIGDDITGAVNGTKRATRSNPVPQQQTKTATTTLRKGVRGSERVARRTALTRISMKISNCSVESQIKFATCTLLAGALTWWNSHVMTVTHDVAYSMTWSSHYCMLAVFPEEADKFDLVCRWIAHDRSPWIHRGLQSQRPCKRLLNWPQKLMDMRVKSIAERQAKTMGSLEKYFPKQSESHKQQQNKRQNTVGHTCGIRDTSKRNVQWNEENKGTVVIKLGKTGLQRKYSWTMNREHDENLKRSWELLMKDRVGTNPLHYLKVAKISSHIVRFIIKVLGAVSFLCVDAKRKGDSLMHHGQIWETLFIWNKVTRASPITRCSATHFRSNLEVENMRQAPYGLEMLRKERETQAIRDQKLETSGGMEPVISMAGAGYLVMEICGL